MRVRRIAALEFRRVARSRGLWLAAATFSLTLAGVAAIPRFVLHDPAPAIGLAFLLGPATDLILPIIAILLTYGSVAGPHERGSLKLLLGTPHRRDDVLYGTILGRMAVMWVVVAVGFAVAGATILVGYGRPPFIAFVAFLGLTVLAAATYVIIGVSVSAALRTRVGTVTILIAGFVVARSLWTPLCEGVHYLLVGELPGPSPPRWFEYLVRSNPVAAYRTAADGILPASPHLAVAIGDEGVAAASGDVVGGTLQAGELFLSIGVLVAWSVLAVLIGRHRFRRAELG